MKIILFRGRPGAGKTTLSSILAKEINAPVLRKDDIYDVAAELLSTHQDCNKLSYNSLYQILASNTQTNCTFILDYPFQTTEDLAVIKNWCLERGVELKSILVTCTDEKLWADRFNVRSINPAPNQLITNFDTLKEHYGNIQITPEPTELLVDTAQDQDSILEVIRKFI